MNKPQLDCATLDDMLDVMATIEDLKAQLRRLDEADEDEINNCVVEDGSSSDVDAERQKSTFRRLLTRAKFSVAEKQRLQGLRCHR